VRRWRPQRLRGQIVEEQIRIAADRRRERNCFPVWRPCRVENLTHVWHFDLARHVAVGGVQNGQHCLAGVHAAPTTNCGLFGLHEPGADELQAGEVRIRRPMIPKVTPDRESTPSLSLCSGLHGRKGPNHQVAPTLLDGLPLANRLRFEFDEVHAA